MEIRNLRSFIAVAEAGSMTQAAKHLHLSQPAISHQMRELEEELGCALFNRHSHSISLTTEGRHLRDRAHQIVELADRTVLDLSEPLEGLAGEVRLGAGESDCMSYIADVFERLREEHPQVTMSLRTGYDHQIEGWLEDGSIDFGILFEPSDYTRYGHLRLPGANRFGIVMRDDDPLAQKKSVTPAHLRGKKLIVSRQVIRKSYTANPFLDWFGYPFDELDVVATIDLPTNATFFVQKGVACLFTFEGLTNLAKDAHLVFRPLRPELLSHSELCWKKGSVLPPASEKFLQYIVDDVK